MSNRKVHPSKKLRKPRLPATMDMFAIFYGQDDQPGGRRHGRLFEDEGMAWRYGETLLTAPVRVTVLIKQPAVKP